MTVRNIFPVSLNVRDFAVSPGGGRLYLLIEDSPEIIAVNARSGRRLETLSSFPAARWANFVLTSARQCR